MLRILTAAVLLPALWATLKLAPPEVFSGVALAVIAIACWECLGVLGRSDARPFKGLALVGALAVSWSLSGSAPHFGVELPLVLLLILAVVGAMWRRAEPAAMLRTTLATIFPVLFVGLGLGYTAGLRAMPGEDGPDLLMLLFVCVFIGDTAAYYAGTRWGRRRLAPTLSPKKSWEGAVAGLAASLIGAWIAHAWFYQRLPLGHALALGLFLGVAAILGDLAESMLKRAAGVKDSSRLLPGHGGVLDRTDSLLFAGPLLHHYYLWFLQGSA